MSVDIQHKLQQHAHVARHLRQSKQQVWTYTDPNRPIHSSYYRIDLGKWSPCSRWMALPFQDRFYIGGHWQIKVLDTRTETVHTWTSPQWWLVRQLHWLQRKAGGIAYVAEEFGNKKGETTQMLCCRHVGTGQQYQAHKVPGGKYLSHSHEQVALVATWPQS